MDLLDIDHHIQLDDAALEDLMESLYGNKGKANIPLGIIELLIHVFALIFSLFSIGTVCFLLRLFIYFFWFGMVQMRIIHHKIGPQS